MSASEADTTAAELDAVVGKALNLRWHDDPIARYFQASHFFPNRQAGHLLFELEQLCAAAGLTIRKENADTGTFAFITAERTA